MIRTVDSLAVFLLLPIIDGVFILGHHLLLAWHLGVPPLDRFGLCHSVAFESGVHGVDDLVDGAKPLALPELLVTRETPGDFPVESRALISFLICLGDWFFRREKQIRISGNRDLPE